MVGRASLPQPGQRKTRQILGTTGKNLVGAGPGSLSLWQQPAGLGDEFCDFEGLYEEGYVVLLQEWALVTRAAGESEQDVAFHGRTVFFDPSVGLFGVPLRRAFCRS